VLRGELRTVTPLERLMYLRTLPLFAELGPQELAVLARYAVENRFRADQVLLTEGRAVDAIYLIVDGEVRVSRGGRAFRTFRSRDAVGVFGLLAGGEGGVEAVAAEGGLALELAGPVLFDIFADHFAIFDHVLRAVARVVRAERSSIPGDAGYPPPPDGAATTPPARPLDFAERMLVLRRSVPFGEASLMGLSQMARRATEVQIPAGRQLWSAGDATEGGLLLRTGAIACRSERGQAFRFGPGDGVGIMDVFAREPRWYEATAETDVVAITIGSEVLADVLEDHTAMARSCLSLLAGQALSLFERRAALGGELPAGLDGVL
jgi:CRP-like cAMP-binding protein